MILDISLNTLLYTGGIASIIYTLQLFIEYRRYVHSIGDFPGIRLLFSPREIIGNLSPIHIPYITMSRYSLWDRHYKDFEKYGSDIISTVALFPRTQARLSFQISDAAAIKEITSQRAKFPKPTEQYEVVSLYGRNIVATEGEEWKRHRKTANPAFSEPNNKQVWADSVRITLDMLNNVWQNQPLISLEHANDTTLMLALLIIGSAGFGRSISFAEDLKVPEGHKMSFKDALHVVSQELLVKVLFPSWLRFFSKRVRRIDDAVTDLKLYMQELIQTRRSEESKSERYDLFSLLLDANQQENEDSDLKLSDTELMGNIYIFLLAGHETTAHTLCFTLALLALYPDEQEKLYQKIIEVIPDGRLPEYEDMNSLAYVTAVFHETLRLFPPVGAIPKKCEEDTVLTTFNKKGERISVPVPKESRIVLYTPGLHYNPRYWKDPNEFRPQRFMEDWPRDAFLPFSGGPRSCIGRRFSETEATAILSILISRYKVEIKEEPEFQNESFEERKARILRGKPGVTWTPIRVPLVFKKR